MIVGILRSIRTEINRRERKHRPERSRGRPLRKNKSKKKKIWQATSLADNRIEPIACGEKEWETDQGRPILEIARRKGIIIAA